MFRSAGVLRPSSDTNLQEILRKTCQIFVKRVAPYTHLQASYRNWAVFLWSLVLKNSNERLLRSNRISSARKIIVDLIAEENQVLCSLIAANVIESSAML